MKERYDLAIIGAGSAGLTAAEAALTLGARVALVEAQRVGGDCTWTGCIPSKALIAAAKVAHTARRAADYGIVIDQVDADFAAVMRSVRAAVETIYREESPEALRQRGLNVIEAQASFTDPQTLCLSNGTTLRARRLLICTGASPILPAGFQDAPCLTTKHLFDLKRRPDHLIVVGGGPVGVEMAQAFRRLGARVTLIGCAPRLLPRADAEASALLQEVFEAEGIHLKLGMAAICADEMPGEIAVRLSDGSSVQGDAVLVAVGRQPNLAGLHLDAARVDIRDGQLVLDSGLRTSQRHILAAGDVTGGPQYTHYAGWQAVQAVRNALLPFPATGALSAVPSATFTDPEIAQAGLTETQADGVVQVTRLPLSRADRAVTLGETRGFLKLIHRPDGRLLGVTLVGPSAGEMINEWIAVLERRGRIGEVVSRMHVYPTLGTANVVLGAEQVKTQLRASGIGRVLRAVVRGWSISGQGSSG